MFNDTPAQIINQLLDVRKIETKKQIRTSKQKYTGSDAGEGLYC